MKAAKKKGVITFKGEMLLQGAHDNVRCRFRLFSLRGLLCFLGFIVNDSIIAYDPH